MGGAQQVKGVEPLRKGINPATWMLEVSTLNKEHELGVDFAEIYRRSDLHRCAPSLDALMATLKPHIARGIMLRSVCCMRALSVPVLSALGAPRAEQLCFFSSSLVLCGSRTAL